MNRFNLKINANFRKKSQFYIKNINAILHLNKFRVEMSIVHTDLKYIFNINNMGMHLRIVWEIRFSTIVSSAFSAIFVTQASFSVEVFFLLASSWMRKWSFRMLTTASTRHNMTRGLKNTTRVNDFKTEFSHMISCYKNYGVGSDPDISKKN